MTKKITPQYRFALRDVLSDLSLSQKQARIKFKFDIHGKGYISRTGFVKLCNYPKMVSVEKVNIICRAMKIAPSDLWRIEV